MLPCLTVLLTNEYGYARLVTLAGSDDGTQASDDDDAGSPAEDENQQPMRGGSSSSYERAVAPVVTTGHPSGQGGTHGGSGVASVTTGAMAASGRGTKRTRAAPTPKGGSSASQCAPHRAVLLCLSSWAGQVIAQGLLVR